MKNIKLQFLIALFLPFSLILGGGIWGGTAQHTHRSADQGGVISWIPTGFVGCYAGASPPANTLEAYGQAVSRITYSGLFGHLGTTHGAGDGVTTFNLPDLRGRVMIGMDNMGGSAAGRITSVSLNGANSTTLGGAGGEQTHIVTIAEMPAHKHALSTRNGSAGGVTGITDSAGSALGIGGYVSTSDISSAMGNTGGGAAHNNTQPWLALKCVMGT